MKISIPAKPDTFTFIVLFFFSLLFAGLPNSKFLLSIGQIGLAFAFVYSYFKRKSNLHQQFRTLDKSSQWLFYSLVIYYCLHLIGMLYTDDRTSGPEDLRIKLPIIIIPLFAIFFSSIIKPYAVFLIRIFIISVFITLLTGILLISFENIQILNHYRNISPFISHIRFSLMMVFCVVILLNYNVFDNFYLRIIAALFIIWALFYWGMFSGLVPLIVIFLMWLLSTMVRNAQKYSRVIFGLALTFMVFILIAAIFSFNEYKNVNLPKEYDITLKKERQAGWINGADSIRENGYLIYDAVNLPGLIQAWNNRSTVKIDMHRDIWSQNIIYTLLRYLSSKGMIKDSLSVNQLSENEIKAIEENIPNYLYLGMPVWKKRIFEIFWEWDTYLHFGLADGKTTVMRYLYWNTAIKVISRNFLTGVGTGDVKSAIYDAYKKYQVPLSSNYYSDPHNQWLTSGVAFGIWGIFSLLLVFTFAFYRAFKKNSAGYFAFLIIGVISMMTDDTLETQIGVTFFILLLSWFEWFDGFNAESETTKKIRPVKSRKI